MGILLLLSTLHLVHVMTVGPLIKIAIEPSQSNLISWNLTTLHSLLEIAISVFNVICYGDTVLGSLDINNLVWILTGSPEFVK